MPTAARTPPPTPSLPPTPPAAGLVFVDPPDGATVGERDIIIRGVAPPGSVVTHDIPNWFDEHTTADSQGRWSFIVSLNVGQNVFMFRVADDMSTERSLTIYYQPA